ncbi:MAG: hypothetical protein H0X35_07680 [Pseudonocardiales bacterium]|nr:hypothetical protein [Pseudonocardiales bacterium]
MTHQTPMLSEGQGFTTVLTLALSWPDNNLSSVVISPSAQVTIDED